MISMHESVAAAISAIPASTFYNYPQDWNALPSISYYEISNLPETASDDREYSTELEYVVDVWALSPLEMVTLALQADEAMTAIGFTRAFSLELYEKETKIHHKNMRFSGTFANSAE